MNNENDSDDLHIKDKRRFNPDGSIRGEEIPPIAHKPQEASPPPPKEPQPEKTSPPFKIDFSTFVLSLASSVQINLGLYPHPATQKSQVHLEGAKQTIDIIGMLEEKTRGNLSEEEAHLIKQILFEIRM